MTRKAVFLDRDGVINIDHGYVHKIDDFVFIPGVFDALRKLQDMGYLLVIVTNQSGIARGHFTEHDFQILCEWMIGQLRIQGINLTAVYHCPHLHDAPVERYRQSCQCRKPLPGMIATACHDWNIDPSQSLLFGDHERDIQAGLAAGVHNCIKVACDEKGGGLWAAVEALF